MRADVNVSFRYGMNTRQGVREKVGMALRSLADKLDGRQTMAVRLECSAPISAHAKRDVIMAGWKMIELSMHHAAHLAATDMVFEQLFPELQEKQNGIQ